MRRFHWSNSGRRFGFACALGLSAAYVAVTGASGQPQACGPGAGPCDMPHNTPGCDDTCGDEPCAGCCEAVCAVNPACCFSQWDDLCVQLASKLCVQEPACGVAGTGDCSVANGSPFCDDLECCETVCAVDTFCCDTEWDQICADEAAELCACTPADVPPNDDCANAVAVSEGVFAYTTACATHDGPADPTGLECDDKVGPVPGAGLEVWFDYTPGFSGTARVYTCGQADYDTELIVYDGCDCPAPDANIIDCNNTGLTCPAGDTGSEIVFDVVAGNCYKIAVGGLYAFTGAGTVTIEPAVIPDACVNGIGDCLQANGTVGCADQACCVAICANNPDCCDLDWDQACADAAATDCGALPCGPIDTSAANLDEGEPCGDDTNGGCNSTPPAFTDIVSGDVIAGTAWGDGGTRDTDWYRINVTSADDADGDGQVDIHYNVLAELPIVSFLLVDPVGNCNLDDLETPGTVAYSQSCTQIGVGMATVAAPGEYFVFVATGTAAGGAIFDGYPCSPPGPGPFDNNYLLCVNVVDDGEVIDTTCPSEQEPCPWDLNGSGDVGILDLLALLAAWGPNPGDPADFDGNGTVDIFDLLTLIANWGGCP
ncbi:MAG: hypothetical protein IH983_08990 [Planctomycetes bacterium]|nr:hypothetical protein [Planctomycetota bacterium]